MDIGRQNKKKIKPNTHRVRMCLCAKQITEWNKKLLNWNSHWTYSDDCYKKHILCHHLFDNLYFLSTVHTCTYVRCFFASNVQCWGYHPTAVKLKDKQKHKVGSRSLFFFYFAKNEENMLNVHIFYLQIQTTLLLCRICRNSSLFPILDLLKDTETDWYYLMW